MVVPDQVDIIASVNEYFKSINSNLLVQFSEEGWKCFHIFSFFLPWLDLQSLALVIFSKCCFLLLQADQELPEVNIYYSEKFKNTNFPWECDTLEVLSLICPGGSDGYSWTAIKNCQVVLLGLLYFYQIPSSIKYKVCSNDF